MKLFLIQLTLEGLYLYFMSVAICLFVFAWYLPQRKDKTLKEFLEETKYIPLIPIVNILVLGVALIYSITADIKKNKKLLLDYTLGISIIFLSLVLMIVTRNWKWMFLMFSYQLIYTIIYYHREMKELKNQSK